jgi:SGNH domain (fused to AT3 domains)
VKAFAAIAKAKPAMIVIGQSDDALPGKPKEAAADEQATLSTLLPIVHNKPSRIVTMVDQTEDDYPDGVSDEATCLARAGLKVTYDPTNTPAGLENPNVCYRIFSAPYRAASIRVRTAVAAVDTAAGIIRVDPNPWLCDTTGAYQICPPVILGTLVYHDPWHLSATFVGRLANLLNAAVPKV